MTEVSAKDPRVIWIGNTICKLLGVSQLLFWETWLRKNLSETFTEFLDNITSHMNDYAILAKLESAEVIEAEYVKVGGHMALASDSEAAKLLLKLERSSKEAAAIAGLRLKQDPNFIIHYSGYFGPLIEHDDIENVTDEEITNFAFYRRNKTVIAVYYKDYPLVDDPFAYIKRDMLGKIPMTNIHKYLSAGTMKISMLKSIIEIFDADAKYASIYKNPVDNIITLDTSHSGDYCLLEWEAKLLKVLRDATHIKDGEDQNQYWKRRLSVINSLQQTLQSENIQRHLNKLRSKRISTAKLDDLMIMIEKSRQESEEHKRIVEFISEIFDKEEMTNVNYVIFIHKILKLTSSFYGTNNDNMIKMLIYLFQKSVKRPQNMIMFESDRVNAIKSIKRANSLLEKWKELMNEKTLAAFDEEKTLEKFFRSSFFKEETTIIEQQMHLMKIFQEVEEIEELIIHFNIRLSSMKELKELTSKNYYSSMDKNEWIKITHICEKLVKTAKAEFYRHLEAHFERTNVTALQLLEKMSRKKLDKISTIWMSFMHVLCKRLEEEIYKKITGLVCDNFNKSSQDSKFGNLLYQMNSIKIKLCQCKNMLDDLSENTCDEENLHKIYSVIRKGVQMAGTVQLMLLNKISEIEFRYYLNRPIFTAPNLQTIIYKRKKEREKVFPVIQMEDGMNLRRLAHQIPLIDPTIEYGSNEYYPISIDVANPYQYVRVPLKTGKEIEVKCLINLDPEVFRIIELWRTVSLCNYLTPSHLRKAFHEKEKISASMNLLKEVILDYHSLIDETDELESALLDEYVCPINKIMKLGQTNIRWEPESIHNFVEAYNNVVFNFRSIHEVVRTFHENIRRQIDQIPSLKLNFEITAPDGSLLEALTYLTLIEGHLKTQIKPIRKTYDDLTWSLIALECFLYGTGTGKNKRMREYYKYWEKKCFFAVLKFIVYNLNRFICQNSEIRSLFQITPYLTKDGELKFDYELHKFLPYVFYRISGKIISLAAFFPRWIKRTCLQTPGVKMFNEEEKPFSFYNDIAPSSMIANALRLLEFKIMRTVVLFSKKLQQWKNETNPKSIRQNTNEKRRIVNLHLHNNNNNNMSCKTFKVYYNRYLKSINTTELAETFSGDMGVLLNLKTVYDDVRIHLIEWMELVHEKIVESFNIDLKNIRDWIYYVTFRMTGKWETLEDFIVARDIIKKFELENGMISDLIDETESKFELIKFRNETIENETEQIKQNRENIRNLKQLIVGYKKDLFLNLNNLRTIIAYETRTFELKIQNYMRTLFKEGPLVETDIEKGSKILNTYKKKIDEITARKHMIDSAVLLIGESVPENATYNSLMETMKKINRAVEISKEFGELCKGDRDTVWRNLDSTRIEKALLNLLPEIESIRVNVPCNLTSTICEKMLNLNNSISLMEKLKNAKLQDRHWNIIISETGLYEEFTLNDLLEANLNEEKRNQLNEIIETAHEEAEIESKLNELEKKYARVKFDIVQNKQQNCLGVISNVKTMGENVLNDKIYLVSMVCEKDAMVIVRAVKNFASKLELYEYILNRMEEVQERTFSYDELFALQTKTNDNLEEFKLYDALHHGLMRIVRELENDPLLVNFGTESNKERIMHLYDIAGKLEKNVETLLEKARYNVPRFYYLSDDEILSILGNRLGARAVESVIMKMFNNLKHFITADDNIRVQGMVSKQNEKLLFKHPLKEMHPTNKWMKTLIESMKNAIQTGIKNALKLLIKEDNWDGIEEHPSSSLEPAIKAIWTWRTEQAFGRKMKNILNKYVDEQKNDINEIIERLQVKREKQLETSFEETLFHLKQHLLELTEYMIKMNSEYNVSKNDFEWQKHMRFYWDKTEKHLLVKQMQNQFIYGYEFVGRNNYADILCPLTQRVFFFLTQTISVLHNGLIYGPGGSGKTTMIKHLAKTLGKFCIIMTNTENTNVHCILKILKGVVASGEWGCLKNINKMPLIKLKIINEFLEIAKRSKIIKKEIETTFDQHRLKINPEFGIFGTIDTEKVDANFITNDVRKTFRTVAVYSPDYEYICKSLLSSIGISDRDKEIICEKSLVIINLLENMKHEKTCFNWKLQFIRDYIAIMRTLKDNNEPDILVIKTLKKILNENVSKVTRERLFVLLEDKIFLKRNEFSYLQDENIKATATVQDERSGTKFTNDQSIKATKLQQTLLSRNHVIILGPPRSGKSTTIKLALTAMKFTLYKIYPSAWSLNDLIGIKDDSTRTNDGLLIQMLRHVNHRTEQTAIVMDGDVNALWLEEIGQHIYNNDMHEFYTKGNLINIHDKCHIIIEASDLADSLPSTLNQFSIIYIDSPKWDEFFVEGLEKNYLKDLCYKYFPRLFEKFNKIKYAKHCIAHTAIKIYERYTLDVTEEDFVLKHALFIEALCISFSAHLNPRNHKYFDQEIKNLSELKQRRNAEVGFLPYEELRTCRVDMKSRRWISWYDSKSLLIPEIPTHASVTIPEANLIHKILYHMKDEPILVKGKPGTYKSFTINQHFPNHTYIPIQKATTSKHLENAIFATNVTFDSHKSISLFVDEISPPLKQFGKDFDDPKTWLRMFIEEKGQYVRFDKMKWKELDDVFCVKTNNNEKITDNELRLTSLFNVIEMLEPSPENQIKYFEKYLKSVGPEYKTIVNLTKEYCDKIQHLLLKNDLLCEDYTHRSSMFRIFSAIHLKAQDLEFLERINFWVSECRYVLINRLATKEEQNKANEALNFIEKNDELNSLKKELLRSSSRYVSVKQNLAYKSMYIAKQYFEEIISKHNESHPHDNVEFFMFRESWQHLVFINRVLEREFGHAILIGKDGLGKTSLVKVATIASSAACRFFTLKTVDDENAFHTQIKLLYKNHLSKGEKVALVLKNEDLDKDYVADFVELKAKRNEINLFDENERKNELLHFKKRHKSNISSSLTWHDYEKYCAKNFHFFLIIDSTNGEIPKHIQERSIIARKFDIRYFLDWSTESIEEITRNELINANDEKHKICNCITEIYASVKEKIMERGNYDTRGIFPTLKNLKDYISTYCTLVKEKSDMIDSQRSKLLMALSKVEETFKELKVLHNKLEKQKEELTFKKRNCEIIMMNINQLNEIQEKKREEAINKKAEVDQQLFLIERESKQAKEILAEVLPQLENAKSALDDISKDNIAEMRSFSVPPKAVEYVGYCILCYLGVTDITWSSVKVAMGDVNFLNNLQNRKPDEVSVTSASALKRYLNILEDSLLGNKAKLENDTVISAMRTKSVAGAGLLKYVYAVDKYLDVYATVRPRQELVNKLQADCEKNRNELNKIEMSISYLDRKRLEYNTKLESALAEKNEIEANTEMTMKEAAVADRLVIGLSSESKRWIDELEKMKEYSDKIFGDCILNGALITYLGPFCAKTRKQLLEDIWPKLLRKHNILFTAQNTYESMIEEGTIERWVIQGLPPDKISIQNAIIASKNKKYPLFVDPQKQMLRWIQTKEAENQLKIISHDDEELSKELGMAAKYGTAIMIENVSEKMNETLISILNAKDIGNDVTVIINNQVINIHKDFNLYMSTNNEREPFSAYEYNKTNIIDCRINVEALEEQVLALIFDNEKHYLEEDRMSLIEKKVLNLKQRNELETFLILELNSAKTNILENDSFLYTLESASNKSVDLHNQLIEAEKMHMKIEKERLSFRPIAHRTALLYETVNKLSCIDKAYQISVKTFIKIFEKALSDSQFSASVKKRQTHIMNNLVKNLFFYCSNAMSEVHKNLLALLIALALEQDSGNISKDEIEFFVKGGKFLGQKIQRVKQIQPKWLDDETWQNVCALCAFSPFVNLARSVKEKENEWKEWINAYNPQNYKKRPMDEQNLTDFQNIMLVRTFMKTKIAETIEHFVRETLGEDFAPPYATMTFDKMYEISTCNMPIILYNKSELAFEKHLQKYAEIYTEDMITRLTTTDGMERSLRESIEQAAANGRWILIENIHFYPNMIKDLEKIFFSLSEVNFHFRLWIKVPTSEVFSNSFIQASLIVTIESQSSLKYFLRETLTELDMENTEISTTLDETLPIIFASAFLHSALKERTKFEIGAWYMPFEFTQSDFKFAVYIVNGVLRQKYTKDIPWKAIRYAMRHATYAGHSFNTHNAMIIEAHMRCILNDFIINKNSKKFLLGKSDEVEYFVPDLEDFVGKKVHETDGFSNTKRSVLIHKNDTMKFNEYKENYIRYVDNLPYKNKPEIVCLPNIVENIYDRKRTNELLFCMEKVFYKDLKTADDDDKIEKRVNVIKDALNNILNKNILYAENCDKIKEPPRNDGKEIFLLKELNEFDRLKRKIRKSINEIHEAMNGWRNMTTNIKDAIISIANGYVPHEWLEKKTKRHLSDWILNLQRQQEQNEKLCKNLNTKKIWLGGLRNPKLFIQIHFFSYAWKWCSSSRNQIVFVGSYFDETQMTEMDEKSEDGDFLLLENVWLKGASFDEKTSTIRKKTSTTLLEKIRCLKVQAFERQKIEKKDFFYLPIYADQAEEEKFEKEPIIEIGLKYSGHKDDFILKDTCIILSQNNNYIEIN